LVFTSFAAVTSREVQLFSRERRESPNILAIFGAPATGQQTAHKVEMC